MKKKKHPDHMVWSDASGTWGCGAYWRTRWFQYPWTESGIEWSIAVKEMIPVMWGCFVWGEEWKNGVVQWNCDNIAVVEVINRGSTKDTHLAHLLRCIHFAEAKHNFMLVAQHVQGVTNDKAVDLSPLFLSLEGTRGRQPTNSNCTLGNAAGNSRRGLDRQDLGQVVERLLRESLAPSTRRVYCSAQSRYVAYCAEYRVQPFPTNE